MSVHRRSIHPPAPSSYGGGGALVLLILLLTTQPILSQHLRIFACAIGNDSAGAFMGGSSNGSGLYQSDDTGKTWKHLGWQNIKCYSMNMVQSSNGRILYEATGLGVLRSTDYGEHWKQITDWRMSEVMDVAVNQKNQEEIYLATAHGAWRTRDGGRNWQSLPVGLSEPYTDRIIIDSTKQRHILLASENGIFALTNNSRWKHVETEQLNLQNMTVKRATAIRSIVQVSSSYWIAASENSRVLISFDSAKSFGILSYGADSLWCVAIQLIRKGDNLDFGGPFGLEHQMRDDDELMNYRDARIPRNVSCCIRIGSPREWYEGAIAGTLGNGIYIDNGQVLDHRQIWTLKSFLVTP